MSHEINLSPIKAAADLLARNVTPELLPKLSEATENLMDGLEEMALCPNNNHSLYSLACQFKKAMQTHIRHYNPETTFAALDTSLANIQLYYEKMAEHPLVNYHQQLLEDAVHRVHSLEEFETVNFQSTLPSDVKRLLELTNLLLRYEPENFPYLEPREIEWDYYQTYFHKVLCQARFVESDLIGESDPHIIDSGYALLNSLFNFLADVSLHSDCPMNISTIIRLHLISSLEEMSEMFQDDIDVECRFMEREYDISMRNLKVSREDIKLLMSKSQFLLPSSTKYLNQIYCYD